MYVEEHGEAPPEDARTAYQFSKANVTDVSLLVVKEEQKIYNSLSTKFTLRSMGGNMLQALGFKKKERAVKPRKTLEIVEQKQRQGLFTSTDLGLDLNELDKKLTEKS